MAIADGTESLRGQVKFTGFKRKVQHSVLIDVLGTENGVLHVRVEKGALFAQKVDDFDRITALPKEVAQIAVCTDFFAGGLAELHEGARIIDHEVRVHLQGEALDAVLAGELRGIPPVRNDLLFPLPILHLGIFGRPAIGDPIRLGILWSSARAAGKADDDSYIENFGEANGLVERIDVSLGMLGIRMDGVPMTTESSDVNSPVFKLFQPSFGLTPVVDEVVQGAVGIVRIASRADLHGFQAQGADLVQHGVEGEVVIDRVKHADGNLM